MNILKVLRSLLLLSAIFIVVYTYSVIYIYLGESVLTYTSEDGSLTEYRIPANLREAIEKLDLDLEEKDKNKLVYHNSETPPIIETWDDRMDDLAYGNHSHMGIGADIRGRWGLWGNSKLKRWIFWSGGGSHPDDASSWILREYIKHLNGEAMTKPWVGRITVVSVFTFLLFSLILFLLFVFSIAVKIRRARAYNKTVLGTANNSPPVT